MARKLLNKKLLRVFSRTPYIYRNELCDKLFIVINNLVCIDLRFSYPRFVGSNLTEVDGFFQDVKILSTSPPGGTLSWGSRV